MDTIFHKLNKNDIKYQEYVIRGNGLFDEYKEFVTRESMLAGKVKKIQESLEAILTLLFVYYMHMN